MNISFTKSAMREYREWTTKDIKTLKRINDLIDDIQVNGLLKGKGKPEFLKHRKAYSRRIDNFNRLVYVGDNENLTIMSCKGHYDD